MNFHSRQLAAIMFSDIVSYTALMGEDEDKAYSLLARNRQLQKPVIEEYGGKFIKELGDGILASFPTVIDAVLCANKIQCLRKDITDLHLRIGIHVGDVIFENDDVFGDGVNVASRIQAIAPIDTILISDSAQKIISNKKDIETKFVSEEKLKNVKEAIKVYEVLIKDHTEKSSRSFYPTNFTASQPAEKSIAVLPFLNLSNESDQEYMSDGIAEEILNSLAHLKNLKVAGRSSSFKFRGKNVDLQEVSAKLNVKTILEGSIQRQENRLRITVQLIDALNGFHIWSEKYDRTLDDIFAVQDEIAVAVTENLKVLLLSEEKFEITKTRTENKDAYDLYLKGKFYWNRRGPGLKKGLEFFQQAVAIDPQFGLAYAGIAESYALIALYSLMPPHISVPKAKEAAKRAIELNPMRVEPYAVLGLLYTIYDFDWPKARDQFKKAIEINPAYAPSHYWFSNYLSWIDKDYDKAIFEAKTAIELDPLLSHCHNVLASAHLCKGTFEEAEKASLIAVDLDPVSFLSYNSMGMSLTCQKRYNEAIECLKTGAKVSNRHQYTLLELAWTYAETKEIGEARKIYDELLIRSSSEFVSGLSLAVTAYASKEYDKSYQHLQNAFEERSGFLPGIRSWPVFSFINTDPRFGPVIEKMKFPV